MFLSCLARQTFRDFELWVCVNQPETWWEDPALRPRCERNRIALSLLGEDLGFSVRVLDRTSRGRGWEGKRGGVGAARRLLMDSICEGAGDEDLIVSLDADAVFGPEYLVSIADSFRDHPDASAVAVPYVHPLTGRPVLDRAILRYEIYLRAYAVNLWRIRSPYAFTALGSAMAVRAGAYRAVGGMPERQAGEDFYLLQKLCKHGRLLTWNSQRVYPSPRTSDRVPFGTGPAVLKGMEGDFAQCPVFAHERFDDVGRTAEMFPALFDGDEETPLDSFLQRQLGTSDMWGPLRRNYRDVRGFVRACHGRLDGLRILQYLRSCHDGRAGSDGRNLVRLLEKHHLEDLRRSGQLSDGAGAVLQAVETGDGRALLEDGSLATLSAIRRFLTVVEEQFRMGQARTWNEAPIKVGTS